MLLDIKNLCFAYYKKPLALKDVSIKINKGEKILVLGVVDSSKTTFLKICSGFDTNYFGSVLLNGKEMKYIPDENKNSSLLLSSPVLLERKNIKQNFDFLCKILNRENYSEEELTKILKKFNFEKDLKLKVKKLNLFEKRKLAIIRSSLKNPDYICLDDQFKELSTDENSEMTNLYKEILSDHSKTIICAINDESYLKNKDFFDNFKFDKILFLSLSIGYNYQNLSQVIKEAKTYEFSKFLENTTEVQAEIILKNKEYFVFLSDKKLIKLDNSFDFSVLEIEDDSPAKIFIIMKNNIDLSIISDDQFNKMVQNNEIFIYSYLDLSRLI